MSVASPHGGVFLSNVVVTLTNAAKEIRYTLDGTEPGTNSLLYAAPLLLTNSALLQARAYADGKAGDLLVETYNLIETNVVDFSSHLPLVLINTFGRPIQAATNVLASIRFIDALTNQRATLTATCDFDGRATVKARGYTSLRYPKKSFAVETRNAAGESHSVSILGFPKDSEWILYAPYPDKTLMRDVLAYELSNELGHYASRTRFVEAFVNDTTNKLSRAHYAGVYVLEEKIKRSKKRVALEKLEAEDKIEPAITGGYIFKRDHLEEAGEGVETPARGRGAALHGKLPTGPGGFPADPAGFLPAEPLFTNAVSFATNSITVSNTSGSSNVVLTASAIKVILTNSVILTNTLALTNSSIVTNLVVTTNSVISTNVNVVSKAVVATNPVVATSATAGTNSVATTNVIDSSTTVVTTTIAVTTATTYKTNLVVVTNTLSLTNLVVATNFVSLTNAIVSTNVSFATNFVVATNLVFSTNTFVLTPQKPWLLEELVTTGKGFVTSRTNAFFYVEPKASRITAAQRTWLSNHLNQFEQVLAGPDFRNPKSGYPAFIDIDSFIDQHLFVEATKNIDGFRFSTFFTKDRDGKIKMEPIWDWNLSFGNSKGKHGHTPEHWYWPQLDDQQYPWFRRLFEDPDFGQRYVDRWAQWRTNIFSCSHLITRVDELAAFLKEPAARNFQRWPVHGTVIGPEYFAGRTFDEDVHYLKSWISNRLDWMNAQFLAPPSPSDAGGVVTNASTLALTASAGQVYYTIDGSDPRVPGGNVSSTACPYQSPISVTNSVTITARSQKENRWSSPVTVRFVLLRIPPPTGG